MKKKFYLAIATYTALTTFSNLNAVDTINDPDQLRKGSHDHPAGDSFNCPSGIPGAYTTDLKKQTIFLEEIAKVTESANFFARQTQVAGKAGLSNEARANLTQFQAAQIAVQIYFANTGEGYVATIPFVEGKKDKILEIAQATGFMVVHRPLQEYMKYNHLEEVFNGQTTLVLGCGQLVLNKEIHQLAGTHSYYLYDGNTGYVSSSGNCNHANQLTIATTPGIFPDIVADVYNPLFQRKRPVKQ